MFNFDDSILDTLIIHHIGNKAQEEGVKFSKNSIDNIDENINSMLMQYFLSPFKDEIFHSFSSNESHQDNVVFKSIDAIFDNVACFNEESVKIASHLYETSRHPNIKSGEFYLVYFNDCVLDDEVVDAIGIFKSENKETYMKVFLQNDCYNVGSEEGIDINKLDKGCIVFNTDKENGFLVSVVDNTNKQNEAQYWVNDFLNLKVREDDFLHTQNFLGMCKGFVEEVYNEKEKENVEKTEKIDMLNKSINYFKGNDTFDKEEFEHTVLEQPEVIEAFQEYKRDYQQEKEIPPMDEGFDISNNAVKQNQKHFKCVLKLDKNFHVYIHGDKEFINKGYDDEKGMNYYQLFYEKEV